jgi:uncharacterized protein DUF4339
VQGAASGLAALGVLMSKWYVAVEGQARGPVSTETVLTYLQTRNRAEVYVWHEGFTDWRLAKDVAELARPIEGSHWADVLARAPVANRAHRRNNLSRSARASQSRRN